MELIFCHSVPFFFFSFFKISFLDVCVHFCISARVSSSGHVTWNVQTERGPQQPSAPGYQALAAPGIQETCSRTIWNIPLDHLLLMWYQVHNQTLVSLPPSYAVLTVPAQHSVTCLICILMSTLVSRRRGRKEADAVSLLGKLPATRLLRTRSCDLPVCWQRAQPNLVT